MAKKTYVVAYEGDEDGTRVLDAAIEHARQADGRLNIVHILEWSPYQFLTPEEIEERSGRRKQELSRAQESLLDPAIQKARDAGVEVTSTLQFGAVAKLVAQAAEDCDASAIFVGRSGSDSIGARIFGSVPLALAQIATVPTIIIP